MITCSKCGETMGDDVKFCPSCGTGTSTAYKSSEPAPVLSQIPATAEASGSAYNENRTSPDDSKVSFGRAIKNFIVNIVNFSDKTGKREYWFGFLFFVIICVGTAVADYIPGVNYVVGALSLIALLPLISMTARRLNDLGLPRKRIFLYLVPVYGQIRFFIELTK